MNPVLDRPMRQRGFSTSRLVLWKAIGRSRPWMVAASWVEQVRIIG